MAAASRSKQGETGKFYAACCNAATASAAARARCAARNSGRVESRFPGPALALPRNLGFNLNKLGYLFVAAIKTAFAKTSFQDNIIRDFYHA